MSHRSTRRKFIATLGAAGTVAFAGCSAMPGDSNTTPNNTNTTSSSPTQTPTTGGNTGTPGTSATQNGGNSSGGQNNNSKTPFTRGELVDDFEGDIRWQVDYGQYKVTKDPKKAYQGSQSLVLEPLKPSKRRKTVDRPYARISKFFTGSNKALDLSKRDLTMAVKVEKPAGPVDITANLHAPTGSISLTSTREIPKAMDDWVRYDLGYTSVDGNPKLKNVIQLEIIVATNPETTKDFRVRIDGLRTIPKPNKGKVILQFDDGHISAYKNAYPVLQEKGWPATCGIIPDAIGAENRLTVQMMTEMSEDGWDMASHPRAPPSTALPGLPPKVQRRKIASAHKKLKLLNFEKGARHFIAPYNRVSATTLDIVSDYHETGFLFGACPNNAQHPSNPYFISRVNGPSIRGTKDVIDMAERFNQMAVVSFHIIGGDGMSMNAFKRVMNYIEKKDVDVITPSQLIDSKTW